MLIFQTSACFENTLDRQTPHYTSFLCPLDILKHEDKIVGNCPPEELLSAHRTAPNWTFADPD